MSRYLKNIFFLWYAVALLLPWTGWVTWRAFSIPSGAAVLFLAVYCWLAQSRRLAAQEVFSRLETVSWDRLQGFIWIAAALFFIWLMSVKLCQYVTFQSHFLDLGQDANVMWNTLNGRPFFDSYEGTNFLGDHFEPVLALCGLSFKLWRCAAALLLLQSAALALAVLPFFALARLILKRKSLAVVVVGLFMLNPFFHMVSAFDFHPESIFIPAALWALLCWEKKKPWLAALIALLCLGIKEDVALALAGFGIYIGLGGIARDFKLRTRMAGWLWAAACFGFFIFVTFHVIPHFAGSSLSVHRDRYASLGASNREIIGNVLRHPWLLLGRFFRPQALLSVTLLLATVGFLPLAAPMTLIPVLLACLHHLVSDYRSQYALVSQYSAQTLPFLFYAALKGLSFCEERLWEKKQWLAPALLFIFAVDLLFQPQYSKSFKWSDVLAGQHLIGQIPAQASVAADGSNGAHGEDLIAHLALQSNLQALRMPTSSDYILLGANRSAEYSKLFAASGAFSRVGEGIGLELWRK